MAAVLPYLKRDPKALTRPGLTSGPPSPEMGEGLYARIVIGVDPPASAMGDDCGIVVCGLGADGGSGEAESRGRAASDEMASIEHGHDGVVPSLILFL